MASDIIRNVGEGFQHSASAPQIGKTPAPPVPAAASSSPGIFSHLTNLFKSYGPTVFNGIVVVSTIGSQSLVNKFTFNCPCSYPLNVYQSAAFLIGPCLALFMFAVLFNSNTWVMIHGCCFRDSSAVHPLSTAILYWLEICAQASIAPVAWLFVAFLDGGYYSCLRAHVYCPLETSALCSNFSLVDSNPQAYRELTSSLVCGPCVCSLDPVTSRLLSSQSQVIAWVLISVVGVIALMVVCMVRMCDRYTITQNNYVQMYREVEKGVFESVAIEHATQVARQNATAFFSEKQLSKSDWDLLSTLPSLESPFMLPNQRILNIHNNQAYDFTKLEKWNKNHSNQRLSARGSNGNAVAPHTNNVKFE